MIRELDTVVLLAELQDHGLRPGDVGTIVLIHGRGTGYEVEFATLDGETVAVVTLSADQVRPIARGEIAHARALASRAA
jgi:hypothetical protein